MSLESGNNDQPVKGKPAKKKKANRRPPGKGGTQKTVKRLAALLVAALLIGAAAVMFYFVPGRKGDERAEQSGQEEGPGQEGESGQEEGQGGEPEQDPEAASDAGGEEQDIGSDVIGHIITAGGVVQDSFDKRPKSYELTGETVDFAHITECIIDPETKRVSVTLEGDGIPKSDDKYYYLFALNTFDDAISGDSDYLDRDYKDKEIKLTASLNYNLAGSRLFKKFVVAVKKDGKYVPVSTPKYITNPEVIAKYSSVYRQPASKKGLLVDPNKLRGNELDNLGVKQAAYNIPVARLLGPTTSAAYPTIYYTYNGKTYAFNGQVVAEYDLVFSTLDAKGISTTAIILNNYSSSYPQLIHPKARGGGSVPYYMFNGAEESGVEYMAAIGSFLAERYSDSRHGRISCWIIANEINARKEWNYMAHTDIGTYVEEYARAFRVFYTAIKSVSSSARVYISLDQQWDRNIKNNTNYDGRDILDEFNRNISSKGNIDWGVAQHPYNVPLTETAIWKPSKYVEHNANTSMMTMANIEVLVNYLRQEQFRDSKGEVRSIQISELGYTANAGEANQAAAFAYAYYKIAAYDEIDGFLLNRQSDAPEEVSQGLSFGLYNSGGGHRQIYDVFKYIDTADHAQYTDFAKSIIGISDWNEIMR